MDGIRGTDVDAPNGRCVADVLRAPVRNTMEHPASTESDSAPDAPLPRERVGTLNGGAARGMASSESGNSVSPWLATVPAPDLPPLSADAEADVCVIGAGIAGLSCAYELASAGRSVIVIDQARFGDGQTGRTTAHLVNALDDRYFELERLHGEDGARLAAESHTTAIARVARIAAEERIECELERLDGWLFAPQGEPHDLLERELEACRKAGLSGVALLPRAPIAFDTGPALRFPDQMQLHPLAYLAGLTRALLRRGAHLHAHTQALSIKGGKDAHVVTAGGPVIRARHIVVATNTPFNDRVVIHTKQAAYQTYVIGARIPAGAVARGLYWDTLDPYHYVRLAPAAGGDELLIVGGEDHKTGQEAHPEERWQRLELWTRRVFPEIVAVEHRWSGQVMEPVDGLAFIGRNPLDDDNVFVATGDSGNGMTHGVIAGLLISALIGGSEHPWTKLYDPSRRTLRAAGAFTRENLNVAKEYTAWIEPGDKAGVADVPRGGGALVRRGLKLFAVHVDEGGRLHECSAVCPHLGCIVQWNGAEKTWDCPCHGSRFDTDGRVIHGPAVSGLAASESPAGASEHPVQRH
jgi:glycine/D-amino acid oxidase-like deaminating enzyme/nitrite reductase/ring-hydroxylating ferredoxin subunit